MIEFTFQVAMRMPHNLPGGYDNRVVRSRARPRGGGGPGRRGGGRTIAATASPAGPRGRQTSAEAPGASRMCSAPPSAPIWWS
ncbi:hypothetical protein GCM10010448_06370 [Streptomyces glomeratus]|uniref:Uncharacterized protein n=1 Tax=Streptomyces glomeratus TaxID=284452 RepID=A0ABP6L2U8_9ACTN